VGAFPIDASANSYLSTGLSASTTYYYRVRAPIGGTNDSANSNTASATTTSGGSAPAAPSGLGATANSSSQITLSWTDNATTETGFKVERKTGVGGTYAQIGTAAANATSYPDSGLTASTAYYYRVRATNSSGDSAYSNEANATTQAAGTDAAINLGTNNTAKHAVALADTASTSVTGSITVEGWVRPTSINATGMAIASRRKIATSGTGNGGYELRVNSTGKIVFATFADNGTQIASYTSTGLTLAANTQWHHVSGSYDGTTMRVSLDGVVEKPRTNTGAGKGPVIGGTKLQVGRSHDGAGGQNYFSGKIDEVRISNAAIYTGTSYTTTTSLGADSNTKAYYKFNENTGTTAADATGLDANNHLTLQGSATWGTGVSTGNKRKRAAQRAEEPVFEGASGAISGESEAAMVGESEGYASNKLAAATTVSWTQHFAYDLFGNMMMSTGPLMTTSKATNRIRTTSYVYDTCENLTAAPNGRSYLYDGENRLWQVKQGSTIIATYVYNGEGRRVRKNVPAANPQTTRFLYSVSGSLATEYTGTSTFAITKEFAYGLAGLLATIDIAGSTHTVNFLIPDHLGTPRVITNASGGVVSRHDYKPFGEGSESGRATAGLLGGTAWQRTR
jgi:YD repeat-containing protein